MWASDPRTVQGTINLGLQLWGLITFAEQADVSDSTDTPAVTDTAAAPVAISSDGVELYADGSYEITDWSGYPDGVPQPEGPFRLREGDDYKNARNAADNKNQSIHRNNPALKDKQIHEIKPVKHGGSPTDPANKVALSPAQHRLFTTFWNRIQRTVELMQRAMRE
jgi:hypothetical protein